MTLKDAKIIKDSEERKIPIFVFTAKDKLSLAVLHKYLKLCAKSCIPDQTKGVIDRLEEFENWQIEHSSEIKYPD